VQKTQPNIDISGKYPQNGSDGIYFPQTPAAAACRQGGSVMKELNTVLGIFRSKFMKRPFYIRFHITHRCNYQCRMCEQHRDADRFAELSLEQIRRVARAAAELGARHVVITGGEPFLRPDLPEAIAAFNDCNFSVRVQTNGGPQVTAAVIAKCARAGLQDLSVSLDTLDRPLQDEICQAKGVVDNALRTLALAREVLSHSMSQANIVASRFNFAEIPDLVKYFHGMGSYSYVTPVMILNDGNRRSERYRFRSADADFRPESLPAAVHNLVLDRLIALRKQGHGLTNSTRYLRDYREYLASGRIAWRCEAGTLCLDILPDGQVSICKEKPAMGNILDPNFKKYYRSREFVEKAKEMIGSCSGCFYGEYREPQYVVRDPTVLAEWVRDWLRIFRLGMKFKTGGSELSGNEKSSHG
jgi:MoaA/NifB/PqqE/SkfB family radical SAM enzyme